MNFKTYSFACLREAKMSKHLPRAALLVGRQLGVGSALDASLDHASAAAWRGLHVGSVQAATTNGSASASWSSEAGAPSQGHDHSIINGLTGKQHLPGRSTLHASFSTASVAAQGLSGAVSASPAAAQALGSSDDALAALSQPVHEYYELKVTVQAFERRYLDTAINTLRDVLFITFAPKSLDALSPHPSFEVEYLGTGGADSGTLGRRVRAGVSSLTRAGAGPSSQSSTGDHASSSGAGASTSGSYGSFAAAGAARPRKPSRMYSPAPPVNLFMPTKRRGHYVDWRKTRFSLIRSPFVDKMGMEQVGGRATERNDAQRWPFGTCDARLVLAFVHHLHGPACHPPHRTRRANMQLQPFMCGASTAWQRVSRPSHVLSVYLTWLAPPAPPSLWLAQAQLHVCSIHIWMTRLPCPAWHTCSLSAALSRPACARAPRRSGRWSGRLRRCACMSSRARSCRST